MLSNILDRISFWSLFVVIVLLPIFFLPFTRIPVEISKGLLLVVGLSVSLIFWATARFFDGKIVLPKSKILSAGLGVVIATLISAIFSMAPKASFFGIMFDIGSFYFILSAFLLLFLSSILIKDIKKSRIVFFGFILSATLALLFQVFHTFLPQTLSLGLLSDKTSNMIGSFNALGIFAGFIIFISIFIFSFFSFPKKIKYFFIAVIALSLFLLMIVNFSFIWIFLGIFALFIFVYKISFSTGANIDIEEKKKMSFSFAPFIIVIISLLFFIGGSIIGGFLPNRLNISNTEVRPSFMSTVSIAKAVLKKDPILGSGPNLFSEMWDLHKPSVINGTYFWDTSFETGSGLLPTFMATNGALGILAWLAFLVMMLLSGFKVVFSYQKEKGNNKEMILFFLASLYLFTASFFCSVGIVLFLLAFAFLGIFIGIHSTFKEDGEKTFMFLSDPRKSFFMIIFLIAIILISFSACFKYVERFASLHYFQKALASNSLENAQNNINKTLSLYQNDLYLRTYTQISLLKFNNIVSKGQDLTDTEKADIKTIFEQIKQSAELAVGFNKTDYLNYKALAMAYEALAPSGVADAYSSAIDAYKKAGELNPLNPGIKLAMAQAYFLSGDVALAKDYANQALTLKYDYIDALIVLSQIAKSEGKLNDAYSYAKQALYFAPQNTQLSKYVDSLSTSSTPAPVVIENTTDKKNNKNTKTQ